jgi:hypothetical protein
LGLKNYLGIKIGGMLYSSMSHVTEEDIKNAETEISKYIAVPENICTAMLDNNPLVNKKYNNAFEIIQGCRDFDTTQLDNENSEQYKQRTNQMVVNLTQKKVKFLIILMEIEKSEIPLEMQNKIISAISKSDEEAMKSNLVVLNKQHTLITALYNLLFDSIV